MLPGIGRATAIALVRARWNVAIVARRMDKLRETADLCGDAPKIHVFEGDVTDENSVSELFRSTVERFGKAHIQCGMLF